MLGVGNTGLAGRRHGRTAYFRLEAAMQATGTGGGGGSLTSLH